MRARFETYCALCPALILPNAEYVPWGANYAHPGCAETERGE